MQFNQRNSSIGKVVIAVTLSDYIEFTSNSQTKRLYKLHLNRLFS
jgi:hypothetical protein